MRSEVAWCDVPGCGYVTRGSDTTKCALHEEAARVAASVEVVGGSAVLKETGTRDWEWCEVPGCHGAATSKWDGLEVCDRHGKYGTFVEGLRVEIKSLKRLAFVALFVGATLGFAAHGLYVAAQAPGGPHVPAVPAVPR